MLPMHSSIYGYVMENLRAKRIPQRQVAHGSGVPYDTVTKIAQGQIKDPSVHNIQRLYDFFVSRAPIDPLPGNEIASEETA